MASPVSKTNRIKPILLSLSRFLMHRVAIKNPMILTRLSDGLVLWTPGLTCSVCSKLILKEDGFSVVLDDNGYLTTMTSFSQTFWMSNSKTSCKGEIEDT